MLEKRMTTVFTQEEMARIEVKNVEGTLTINVDVHHLRRADAVRLIRNIIALTRTGFNLVVIHGYVHGNEILKLLNNVQPATLSRRITRRWRLSYNAGVTCFEVAPCDYSGQINNIIEFGDLQRFNHDDHSVRKGMYRYSSYLRKTLGADEKGFRQKKHSMKQQRRYTSAGCRAVIGL